MKRTDMEKTLGSKINGKIESKSESGPFSKDGVKPIDKREQRKLDQAKGLVPFAVKININIVEQIQEIAKEQQISVSEVVTELLQNGLVNRKV